jgi:outer membrane murein-binding lipoprotein Lpp
VISNANVLVSTSIS